MITDGHEVPHVREFSAFLAHPTAVALVREWCRFFADNQRIARWLARHPPPRGWQGSPMEYAFWWMPYADLYGPEIVQVMGQAHVNLAAWCADFLRSGRDLKRLAGALSGLL